MLIKNMDEMNVNGSMGTIVEFVEPNQYLQNPDDPSTFPDAPRLPVEGDAVVHEAAYTGAPEL